MACRLYATALARKLFTAQNGFNLFTAERLILNQGFLQPLQAIQIIADDLTRRVLCGLQQQLDFLVDDLGIIIRVILGHAAKHAFTLIRAKSTQTQAVGETEALDHDTGLLSGHLDV